MAPALNLIHSTNRRWRYRVVRAQQLDWARLRSDLEQIFPPSEWVIRLNTVSESLIIIRLGNLSPQLGQDLTGMVRDGVRQQLIRQGIVVSETPLSPTEVVRPVSAQRTSWMRESARCLANALSMSLSLSALLTSLALFLLGFIGLFLPLSPGVWLLMLATLVFDLALTVRRPFVGAI
jgi:hypothetical protein